jgi:hypothetical protein
MVREAGPALTSETQFARVDYDEPNVIWEMRRVVRGYGQVIPASDVPAFLRAPGPRAVLLTENAWRDMKADAAWRIFDAHGWNAARLRWADLVLVAKP